MKIEIRLFAAFRDYLPPGCGSYSFERFYNNETTVGDVIRELRLPEHLAKIILVNGAAAETDRVLGDKDVLSIFPLIGGG